MTQVTQCDATDVSGSRCTLQAGHSGQHAMASSARPRTSFARVLVTPITVLVAAFLIGMLIPGMMLAAIAIGALGSAAYIVWAYRH
jgi:hypothetical protein